MNKVLVLVGCLFAAVVAAQNQTCLVPSPSAPPKAAELVVKFVNPDGGARPCEVAGLTPGGRPPVFRPVAQGARCDVAKEMADQSVAMDNGWNDGGSP